MNIAPPDINTQIHVQLEKKKSHNLIKETIKALQSQRR